MGWIKALKNKSAYRKLQQGAIRTVNKAEFASYKEGGSISAEMALGLMRGDPTIIKKYDEQQARGVKHIE